MNRPVYIYVINDPRTGLVRYVGKTVDPKQRFRKHLTYRKITLLSKWMKGMFSIGLVPTFEIIDECKESEWQEKERRYIVLFKSFGAKLLNQLPGGEGGATMLGKNLSEDCKRKIGDANRNRKRPDAAINNKKTKGIKVEQYKDGELIAVHESICDAGRAVGRSARRIQMMLNGKGKTVNHVGGYTFKKAQREAEQTSDYCA